MMKFLNCVICYNNSSEVAKYIESILAVRKEISFSIVINAGNPGDRDRLLRLSHNMEKGVVNVYDPKENLGYMNGLLFGYRCYVSEYGDPDYVIFSNTDIEIRDKEFFDKIESKGYAAEIGCIGPSIFVCARNVYDNPVCDERRSVATISRLICIMSIPIIRGIYVFLSDYKGRLTRKKKESSRFVYEVHGCYFILSNSFASSLAQHNYGALMYSEEAYIAEMIRKYGYKVYYDSDIEVVHLEHTVTGGMKSERIAVHVRDSMKYIREEFYKEKKDCHS